MLSARKFYLCKRMHVASPNLLETNFMPNLSPLERYQGDLASPDFHRDPAQANAVEHLDALYHELIVARESKSLFTELFAGLRFRLTGRNPEPVRGVYFWGGVGRGKTYLMDLFFDALPFEQKLRTHFHRFMRSVHIELKQIKQEKDPLEIIAEKFAKQYRVICFDEFFVVDITDAMILANLLDGLFRRGVSLVATSNIVPSGLYQDGLQRARFLPAIALLEKHCNIVNVDGGVDYRLRALKQSALYYTPHNGDAVDGLEQCFSRLVKTGDHVVTDVELEIEGRVIQALKSADGVVWFDFYALCDGPRSQNDYIELAREFHTALVSAVPVFVEGKDDLARRFIYLVDEFYSIRHGYSKTSDQIDPDRWFLQK